MKSFLLTTAFFALTLCLTSCYAFLQADKLIYAGTLAKKPATLQVDTLQSVNFGE